MPTITTVDATWDTGVAMDASELRRADTAMFLGDGTNNGVRGGVVRHADTSLSVTVNGSDQVTVQPGAFVIPAATGLGAYRGALSAATAATAITARNATNPRIDLIVIQATGTNATVKTVDGTPGASPSAPALPAQHIELARITVPQTGGGAVTVDSSFRAYATAVGGTIYVETSARLPGSGNQKGQRAVAVDTGRTHEWNGTAWVLGAPLGAWTNYSPSWTGSVSNPVIGNGQISCAYFLYGRLCAWRFEIVMGSTTTYGSGFWSVNLPFAAAVRAAFLTDYADTGVANYAGRGLGTGGSTAVNMVTSPTTAGAGDRLVTSTVPFTWGNGDILSVSGVYETT